MELLFASHNQNKIIEIQQMLPEKIKLKGLSDLGWETPIPETGETLTENAWIKADFLYQKTKMDCFADDTGLLVEALNGAPGVYSARYAGPEKNAQKNMQKLLDALQEHSNRKAKFVTAIACYWQGEKHLFTGEVKGEIMLQKSGDQGFGYDPIFQPEGYSISFAQMDAKEKNRISHRGIAFQAFLQFINNRLS
ncbi:MAG: RdgB/HAM1 family non-canonical purine NTP pyrophosphatase [Flavobacteriaceae bacterium]